MLNWFIIIVIAGLFGYDVRAVTTFAIWTIITMAFVGAVISLAGRRQ